MRWFKHMAHSHTDERLSSFIDESGLEGYGFWWLLLEIVAAQMDSSDKCEVTYSLPHWSRLLYSHHHKVSNLLGKLEVTGLIATSKSEGKITVTIPNLLKYRDEYSKKSGQTPSKNRESVRSKKQNTDTDTDTDTDKPPISPKGEQKKRAPKKGEMSAESGALFEEWYAGYPRKVNRGQAEKAWEKISPDALLAARMIQAVEKQKRLHDWQKDGGVYIPHPASWLNGKRWEDDIDGILKQQEEGSNDNRRTGSSAGTTGRKTGAFNPTVPSGPDTDWLAGYDDAPTLS